MCSFEHLKPAYLFVKIILALVLSPCFTHYVAAIAGQSKSIQINPNQSKSIQRNDTFIHRRPRLYPRPYGHSTHRGTPPTCWSPLGLWGRFGGALDLRCRNHSHRLKQSPHTHTHRKHYENHTDNHPSHTHVT